MSLLGLASWTGVYGLSFVVFLGGAAICQMIVARSSSRQVPHEAWLAIVVVLALQGFGFAARPEAAGKDAPRVRVAAIQGNIDQGIKWTPEAVEQTLSIYEAQSPGAAAEAQS